MVAVLAQYEQLTSEAGSLPRYQQALTLLDTLLRQSAYEGVPNTLHLACQSEAPD
jgi:hypothetical protein